MPKPTKKESKNSYDRFVRQALSVGFIDDQLDFLWEWLTTASLGHETFTHPDNYTKK